MSTLLRLLRFYRPYLGWLAGGIALNVLVVLSNVGLLALSGWFITAMALSGLAPVPIEYFAPAAAIRGLALLRTGGRYCERLVTHEATFRLLASLRAWFYASLEPLAPARLQLHRGGDLMSRIRSDIDSLDNLYLRVVAPTLAALVSAVLLTGFLALFSGSAALVLAACLIGAGVALPLAARGFGRGPGRRVVAIRAELRSAVSDTVRGLAELVVDAAIERREADIDALSRSLVREQRRQARLTIVSTALSGLVAALALWGTLLVGIPAVRDGRLSGPELAMVAFLVLASFEAVAPLPAAFQALGETLAAAARIFALVDAEPAVAEPACEAAAPCRFDLRVQGLRMRYDPASPWALDGIDLDVPQGGRLGIVGPSGSGKSSLLAVMLRFWEHQAGEVLIGGVAVASLRGETVRGLCSVVAQQTHLFNTSIRENLLLARPGATDDDLLRALRRAHLEADVAALPDGLATVVGENGARFSGGQARRLAIARAFLKDAPILLLDEPTEGLDAASERAVLDGLATLMHGRTTLLITHRPQALAGMDQVVRLDQGRVAAREDLRPILAVGTAAESTAQLVG